MKSNGLKSLVFFCFLVNNNLIGQTDFEVNDSKYNFWTNVGWHVSTPVNSDFLAGAQLGINSSINQKHFLKLNGYVSISPNDIFPTTEIRPNHITKISNLSVLYGFNKFKTNYFFVVPYVGIGYGNLSYRGEYLSTHYVSFLWATTGYPVYKNENFNYIGFPIEVSFILTKSKIGMSLDLYANLHKYPDYGIMINILLGKIR